MNMDEGSGWVDLCAFLGAAIPEIPYPRVYETRNIADVPHSGIENKTTTDSHEVNPMDVIEPVVREMATEHGLTVDEESLLDARKVCNEPAAPAECPNCGAPDWNSSLPAGSVDYWRSCATCSL